MDSQEKNKATGKDDINGGPNGVWDDPTVARLICQILEWGTTRNRARILPESDAGYRFKAAISSGR